MLSVHITSRGRSFSEKNDYSKKVEEVKRDGQDMALDKRSKSSVNFQGSYARGFGRPTHSAKPI